MSCLIDQACEDWGTSNISTSGKNNKKTINNTYEKRLEQVLNI